MTDEEVLALTPPLPKNFNQILEKEFSWNSYMFTWKDDFNRKRGYCTHCKTEMSLELGRSFCTEDLEALQHKHNDLGQCPHCHNLVQWKDRNRGRGKLWEENYIYYFQHLQNGGLLLRTIFCRKDFRDDITKDIEIDTQHLVFFFGGRVYKFRRKPYALYSYYYEGMDIDSWYDPQQESNFIYERINKLTTPSPWQSKMYGRFYGQLSFSIDPKIFKTGQYKYSCLEEWIRAKQDNKNIFKAVEYLTLYTKKPSLTEKLMKQGFAELIGQKFDMDTRSIVKWNKSNVYEALQLNKAEVKLLKRKSIYNVIALQMKSKYKITEANCKVLQEIMTYSSLGMILSVLKDKSINSNAYIKYLRKQKISAYDYRNYLEQLEQLNIEKSQTALYPKSFVEAHNKMSAEITRRAKAKERKALLKQQKDFKKTYEELYTLLSYENDNLLIRPAKGSDDLFTESSVLGHCVYSCYRDKYANGKTIICFIRKKSEPDIPFYTLELSTDFQQIIQCRGNKNCGTTAEVESFKNEWFAWLLSDDKKKGLENKCQKTTAA